MINKVTLKIKAQSYSSQTKYTSAHALTHIVAHKNTSWHPFHTHLQHVFAVEVLPVIDGLYVVRVNEPPWVLTGCTKVMRDCPCHLGEDREKKMKRVRRRRQKNICERRGERECESF